MLSTAPITVPSFDETSKFALSVAVVAESCRCEKPLRGECRLPHTHSPITGHTKMKSIVERGGHIEFRKGARRQFQQGSVHAERPRLPPTGGARHSRKEKKHLKKLPPDAFNPSQNAII
jgi:hypothetical protein